MYKLYIIFRVCSKNQSFSNVIGSKLESKLIYLDGDVDVFGLLLCTSNAIDTSE